MIKNNFFAKKSFWLTILVVAGLYPILATAGTAAETGHDTASTFLWIAIILILAKISGLVEKWGQPAVLGELIIGVIMGNLALVHFGFFEPIKHDAIITFLAELGVVILLFQIGLESNISEMAKVGGRAFLVACVGVAIPFALGYYLSPFLLPGLPQNAYIFIGATLTATSVGITARVFKDLGKLQTKEAKIVLGAAVIDDVLGLIILAAVSAIITNGSASAGEITLIILRAAGFLAGSIFLGKIMAPRLGRIFSKIHNGIGMKFTLAISFGLVFAYLAGKMGLAPIVGAFAAGLVLDPVHFQYFKNNKLIDEVKTAAGQLDITAQEKISTATEKGSERHIEELIEPIGLFLVPIFFVLTGINVKLETMFDPKILLVALAITAIAFIGKIASGAVAGKANKYIVGFGMIPRGEVGLIFAMIGKNLGVVNDTIFSVIVIVVILSTLLTPPILAVLLRRLDTNEPAKNAIN
jgi:Kef-type K+ transport system membrane component KefB